MMVNITTHIPAMKMRMPKTVEYLGLLSVYFGNRQMSFLSVQIMIEVPVDYINPDFF